MNKLKPHLWVSDVNSVETTDVESLGIDHVIGMCSHNMAEHVPLYDHFPINDGLHDYDIFEQAVDKSMELLEQGETLLVHCHVGRSRSVGVCICALVLHYGMTRDDAYDLIDETRRSGPGINEEIIKSVNRYLEPLDDNPQVFPDSSRFEEFHDIRQELMEINGIGRTRATQMLKASWEGSDIPHVNDQNSDLVAFALGTND